MTELNNYFRYKCDKGLKRRGLSERDTYVQRLAYEVDTIISMGFPGYFLIVQDFINWARGEGIYVGPGRGSAAGSLVSYCLGITDLDPIHWDLLFERFLNPDRISMPDIDVDFEKRYRDRVIEYVTQKYGADKVAHIGTFGKMRAKAAVKAACRMLDEPVALGAKLSKLLLGPVHGKPQPLSASLKKVRELRDALEHNPSEAMVLRLAEKLENGISNIGIHASGIVVSNEPLMDTVPLYRGKNKEIVSQWEMNNIEEAGLIKFDFLGLDALDKIHRCIDLVNERNTSQFDDLLSIEDIDPTDPDPKVFERLRAGDSVGIFQLEATGGMRDLLVQIRPTSVEDLVALVAIYRPGPLESDYKDTYLYVRAGVCEPEYLVPELEPILKRTSGWLIYQEQCMEIAKQLCGYTGGQADELRKAIGKKKKKLMDKHESMFKDGWRDSNLSSDSGDEMWRQMCAFAAYGFNRSHAAAYAAITYQTAWLKTYYPREFMCAVMISESGNQDDMIKCLTECKRLGIEVLPPDVNDSGEAFQLDKDGNIRFGLGPIKNVGASVTAIMEERKAGGPFKSLKDFCERVNLGQINRLKLESLIKAGAFDRFGQTRASLLDGVEAIWEYRKLTKAYDSKLTTYTKRMEAYDQRLVDIQAGKTTPKGSKLKPLKLPEAPERPGFPALKNIDEISKYDIWKDEHDLLGAFVSSHPMDDVRGRIKGKGQFNTIEEVKSFENRASVTIPAVVTSVHPVTTKAKKKMAFVTIEDLTGSIETTLFPKTFEQYEHLLDSTRPLRVDGSVDVAEGDEDRVTKVTIRRLSLLDLKEQTKPVKLSAPIRAERAAKLARELKELDGNVHEVDVLITLDDGTEVKLSKNPRIGDRKGAFNRALGRIKDEQGDNK